MHINYARGASFFLLFGVSAKSKKKNFFATSAARASEFERAVKFKIKEAKRGFYGYKK